MQWDNNHIITNSTKVAHVDFQAGAVLLIDKPLGWTSFDVVNKLRFALRHKLGVKKIKVGHAGTLDPLATGLLILCTGKYTKSIDLFQGWDKVYSGSITLGATTPTYDAESEPDTQFPVDHITSGSIEEAIHHFIGPISQVPPMYSAVKINGTAAYSLARRGKDVQIKPRIVQIHSFDTEFHSPNTIHFQVKCSKGTYIRSLANDLGAALRSGAFLQSLRREQIGEWHVSAALSVEAARSWIENAVDDSQGA
jgi:tRNA pseudouridine55 synthase